MNERLDHTPAALYARDLRATACSRLRVNLENFQTKRAGTSGVPNSSLMIHVRATNHAPAINVTPETRRPAPPSR